MQHGDPVAEHGTKAIDGLRRERDLRHEDDGRLPFLEDDALEQLDIDESLAAPGDSVQQRDVTRLPSSQTRDRVRLRIARRMRVRLAPSACQERVALDRFEGDFHEPARDEALEHRCREVDPFREMLDGRAPADRFEQLIHRALLRRAREELVALDQRGKLANDLDHSPRLANRRWHVRAGERRRKCRAQRDAERNDVVLGDPATECEHRLVEHWSIVGRLDDVLVHDPVARLLGADDDAELLAVTKRHHHA